MSDFMGAQNEEVFPYRQENCFRDTENRFADKIPRMPTDFQMRVKLRAAALKMSIRKLSAAAGLSADAVGKMLKEGAGLPRGSSLAGLAKALQKSEQWLLTGQDGEAASHSVDVDAPEPSRYADTEVEIKAVAAGSHEHGAFQLFDNSVGWTPLPRGLAHQKGVYALIVINDSMVPEHKPGAIRFATPERTPRIGDTVVVEFLMDDDRGPEAMIGHLLARGETIKIGKLNPVATVEIPRLAVQRLHRIAPEAET